MAIEGAIRVLAGSIVLIGVSLTIFVHANWIYLCAFVGVNLIQSAFTGFCPPEYVLRKMGFKNKESTCK